MLSVMRNRRKKDEVKRDSSEPLDNKQKAEKVRLPKVSGPWLAA